MGCIIPPKGPPPRSPKKAWAPEGCCCVAISVTCHCCPGTWRRGLSGSWLLACVWSHLTLDTSECLSPGLCGQASRREAGPSREAKEVACVHGAGRVDGVVCTDHLSQTIKSPRRTKELQPSPGLPRFSLASSSQTPLSSLGCVSGTSLSAGPGRPRGCGMMPYCLHLSPEGRAWGLAVGFFENQHSFPPAPKPLPATGHSFCSRHHPFSCQKELKNNLKEHVLENVIPTSWAKGLDSVAAQPLAVAAVRAAAWTRARGTR